GPQEKSTYDFIVQTLAEHGLGKRKRHVAEKLVRIVHLSAFLIGLLAHNNQKIFWMTDHDAICANNELHQQTLNLFQRVLGLYARPSYNFPLIAGARPFPERNLQMLDLLSITDVVAGSLAHYLSQRKKAPSP